MEEPRRKKTVKCSAVLMVGHCGQSSWEPAEDLHYYFFFQKERERREEVACHCSSDPKAAGRAVVPPPSLSSLAFLLLAFFLLVAAVSVRCLRLALRRHSYCLLR